MADPLNNPADISQSPPPGILISGHFTEPFGYRIIRPNGTRDWVMTFTLRGAGRYRVGREELIVRRGDVVVMKPGTPHHYDTPEQEIWDFVWCHFIPQTGWLEYLRLPEAMPGLMSTSIGQLGLATRLERAFDRLIADNLHDDPLHRRLALHALEEALLLVAHSNERAAQSALDPRIEEVLNRLTQRMQDTHSIDELAKSVSLSPSRLAHLFKEQVGDSIIETLLKIRLRHAAKQLEFTTRQVAEIAADVGFRNPFYFTKQFSAFYGMSPTAYRKTGADDKP